MGWRSPAGWVVGVTWAWLVLLSFLQRTGETSFDTKFDLTADPGAFLGRALSLWNPDTSFGELQNQAYGYLFPQGPFFLLGELAGLPDWVVQRLWSGLLLVVAFEGCRRLFGAMAPGSSPWAGWLAGLVYALSPRVLGLSGVLTGEVLPSAVLPWVVLPVVLGQQGVLGPRTAAARSGAAVLLLGGVNAVGNLAALPVALLVVLAGVRRPGGARLLRWWLGCVALASAWWMLPLLVLGRYSPPFLDYIETSGAVVGPLGWTNVARGADHWLAFFDVGGRPWWPGAYELATTPHLVALTAVVSGLGLLGLTRPAMPWRGPLLTSLLLGAVCLTVARPGPLASPLQAEFQYLLDGPLAMLRNVHKVDPLLRLPLALGVGFLATSWVPAAARRRAPARTAALATTVLLLLGAAQPLWTGQQRQPGWEQVPPAWQQAADWLGERAEGPDGDTAAALVLPGAGFGQQFWGWTIDEPIQGLATTPWTSRSQVPLVPGPTIRMLDSIQERIADGQGSPALADLLARAGVEYVVVRRDLDLFASGAPDPARVDLALDRSPGLTSVAGFGSSGLGDQPLVEILRVEREVSRVEAVEREGVVGLAGGPEDVVTAIEAGVLDPATPTVVVGDPGAVAGVPTVVADGYRKRERGFGALDAIGPVMTADEEYRSVRAAHDYAGPASLPPVLAAYDGVQGVVASSSGAYSDTFGQVRPDVGPASVVDGRLSTVWQTAPLRDPVGEWVELRFEEPVLLSEVVVAAAVDGADGVPVRRIRLSTGAEERTVPVDPVTGLAAVSFEEPADRLRVTVAGVEGDAVGTADVPVDAVASLREIVLPGRDVSRRLVLPDVGAGEGTSFAFRARPHRRACFDAGLGTSCGFVSGARPAEEELGLSRELTLDEPGTWQLAGTVVARSTPAAQRLLEPVLGGLRVRASSTYLDEPAVAPQRAADGDGRSFWAAAPRDERPTLNLRLPRIATIRGVDLTAPATTGVVPESAVLVAGRERRTLDLSAGSATFAPVTTRWARIVFEPPAGTTAPVGVAELSLDTATAIAPQTVRPSDGTGAVCGLGPEITVDGTVVPTRVTGTVGAVLDGTPLRLEPCGGPVELTAGTHRVEVTSTQQFAAVDLVLRPVPTTGGTAQPAAATRRPVTVERWEGTDRAISVAAGGEALLTLPQNVNDGWTATLGGRELEPVRVDGWKQGWVLPAGEGGRVDLSFGPDLWYRLALLAGGLLALSVLVLAVVTGRRENERATPPVLRSSGPARVRWRLLGAVPAGLLGGPGLLVGYALGSWARCRDAGALGALCVATAGVAAGVVTAARPGPVPLVCDAVAAVGMGLVAAVLLRGREVR